MRLWRDSGQAGPAVNTLFLWQLPSTLGDSMCLLRLQDVCTGQGTDMKVQAWVGAMGVGDDHPMPRAHWSEGGMASCLI